MRTGIVGYGFSDKWDGYLKGGKAAGEMSLYMALSGVGKTSMLILDAAMAAKSGLNVLYITKEINANKCVQRFDQCYTKFDPDELISRNAEVLAAREKVKGKIWIKDWSHVSTKVSDIRSLILQMNARGDHVDYLVVDYMELIDPEFYNRAQPRMNYSAVCKDLRALGNELSIPQAGAWQAKRAASDKHFLTKDDVGEDWGIVKNADIVIGLNQNAQELRDKVMRLNILKQRESTNRSVMHLFTDFDRMIVHEQGSVEEKEDIEYGK